MNKRQRKKYQKKVIYPLGDECILIGMTDDELKAEYDAYDKYVQKYCHYKHYKDKEKVIRKRGHYYWGVVSKNKSVEQYSNYIQEMRKSCSNGVLKYRTKSVEIYS